MIRTALLRRRTDQVPSGERIDAPFYTVYYDFRLRATTAAVERNV
jgi:hypothetical protein